MLNRHRFGQVIADPFSVVVVVGAGPVGLMVACMLRKLGQHVTIIERRSIQDLQRSPLASSFNVTLVDQAQSLIRTFVSDVDELSIELHAREIWNGRRSTIHKYGLRPTDRLHSIPRAVLVHRLLDVAMSLGVTVIDDATVRHVNTRAGTIRIERNNGDTTQCEKATHIIGADGANSTLRSCIVRQADTYEYRRPDGFCYVAVQMPPEAASRASLSLHHVHFVVGLAGNDIALPNRDGSLSLLLERPDRRRTGRQGTDVVDQFLSGCPETLRRFIPNLIKQIESSPVRRFKYASCGQWAFGKAILLGDAARCCPPYTGLGLNSGLNDAAWFIHAFKSVGGDWSRAAAAYDRERRDHWRSIRGLTTSHGRSLHSGSFGSWAWRAWDRTERLVERLTGRRSIYQRTVFDAEFPRTYVAD